MGPGCRLRGLRARFGAASAQLELQMITARIMATRRTLFEAGAAEKMTTTRRPKEPRSNATNREGGGGSRKKTKKKEET